MNCLIGRHYCFTVPDLLPNNEQVSRFPDNLGITIPIEKCRITGEATPLCLLLLLFLRTLKTRIHTLPSVMQHVSNFFHFWISASFLMAGFSLLSIQLCVALSQQTK